jgi:hypothetical protein
MANVFYFLCFLSFLGILLSLIRPQVFGFVLGKHASREVVLALFWGLFIIFSGLYNDVTTTSNILNDFIESCVLYGLSAGIYLLITFIIRKIKSSRTTKK